MTVRHAVLSLGAVLVLGLGVHLFIEVRSQAEPPAVSRDDTVDAPGARARAAQPARSESPRSEPPRSERLAAPPTATRDVTTASHPATLRPGPSPAPALSPGDAAPDAELVGPRLDAVMDEANKAYDRGEFDEAKTIAGRLLARSPNNVRMLRIMVSASCIDGDAVAAQASYARLPAPDQAQMRTRCARYGVSFPDKP